jgi:hypothetical protein
MVFETYVLKILSQNYKLSKTQDFPQAKVKA